MRTKLYININDLNKAREKQNKYHVSLSTIIDILINEPKFSLLPLLRKNLNIDARYYDDRPKTQTTIMLNKKNAGLLEQRNPQSITIYLSNLLHLYVNNIYENHNDIYDNETINKIKTNIGNELAKKRETYWNYNQLYRNNYRFRKQYEREQIRKDNKNDNKNQSM